MKKVFMNKFDVFSVFEYSMEVKCWPLLGDEGGEADGLWRIVTTMLWACVAVTVDVVVGVDFFFRYVFYSSVVP